MGKVSNKLLKVNISLKQVTLFESRFHKVDFKKGRRWFNAMCAKYTVITTYKF